MVHASTRKIELARIVIQKRAKRGKRGQKRKRRKEKQENKIETKNFVHARRAQAESRGDTVSVAQSVLRYV